LSNRPSQFETGVEEQIHAAGADLGAGQLREGKGGDQGGENPRAQFAQAGEPGEVDVGWLQERFHRIC